MKNFLKAAWSRYLTRFGDEAGFITAALTAAPYVLNALGGIFGNKKKYIDPEELNRKYGPAAIAKNAQDLTHFILNSPYGQKLLGDAAVQGQELQTEMASRAASAGMDASTGAESGASTFAAAAAPQAQAGLERNVKADVLKSALPIAAQQVAGYQQLALANNAERNAQPSTFQRLAAAAGGMITRPGEQEDKNN